MHAGVCMRGECDCRRGLIWMCFVVCIFLARLLVDAFFYVLNALVYLRLISTVITIDRLVVALKMIKNMHSCGASILGTRVVRLDLVL